jgi:citrate lyase subunit beta / citryl-CoA lyase
MKTTLRKFASAGRKDKGIRSDCYVELTISGNSGISIDLSSKVEVLYGDSIRTLVQEVLKELGVKHAKVSIEDRGAVPFVIAARVEAAVRRALVDCNQEYLLSPNRQRKGSSRNRLRRTRLYLPGNDPRFFLNARLHQPDGVILDLEDSVAPTEKDTARILVRNALRSVDFGVAERMVRINSGEMGMEDVRHVVAHGVEVILIPKCESASAISAVEELVNSLREQLHLKHEIYLLPIIESARGVAHAFAIASASELVCGLAIGLEDYCADIGVQRTREGRESAFARGAIVNAACAAGVQPLDSVFSDVADIEALRISASESKALGFKGIGCIHPRQVQVVHDVFAPSENEILKAQHVVVAFEKAKKSGSGVVALGTKMIDMPVVLQAQQTVSLGEALGLISRSWRTKLKDLSTGTALKEDGNGE